MKLSVTYPHLNLTKSFKSFRTSCQDQTFVNENAIKTTFSPKWGNFLAMGNCLGNSTYFVGNLGKTVLVTLVEKIRFQSFQCDDASSVTRTVLPRFPTKKKKSPKNSPLQKKLPILGKKWFLLYFH